MRRMYEGHWLSTTTSMVEWRWSEGYKRESEASFWPMANMEYVQDANIVIGNRSFKRHRIIVSSL
jgi:hypothetical protein